jgi:hypothetical protein
VESVWDQLKNTQSSAIMKPTVYIETTVISYYVGQPSRDLVVAAHQRITYDWWREVLPRCTPYVSPVVFTEIERGDPAASRRRIEAVDGMSLLGVTDEVADLAERYFKRVDIPESARPDSYHLALAAWHGMDFLVTWNCRHIAGARVRWIVGQVNAERGIRTPQICTPEELMEI